MDFRDHNKSFDLFAGAHNVQFSFNISRRKTLPFFMLILVLPQAEKLCVDSLIIILLRNIMNSLNSISNFSKHSSLLFTYTAYVLLCFHRLFFVIDQQVRRPFLLSKFS